MQACVLQSGDAANEAEGTDGDASKAGNDADQVTAPVAVLFGSAAEDSGVPIVPENCAQQERTGLTTKDVDGDVHWRSVFDPELVSICPSTLS